MNDYQRVDQWLWHVRIYKTRLLSSRSIMSGNIEIDQSTITTVKTIQQYLAGKNI